MNTGVTRRVIEVDDMGEDIFADNIKTTALIEEIEAAEFAARQAKIDQEIEASQPGFWRKAGVRAKERILNSKENWKERIEDWRTRVPEDPRVEKVRMGERIAGVGRAMRGSWQKVNRLARRINRLAPEGFSRKQVVEYCIAGALIVIAGEIWAWNFTHPLFQGQKVEEVPLTGTVWAGPEEDEPKVEEQIVTEETPAEGAGGATEANDSGGYSAPRSYAGNGGGVRRAATESNSGASNDGGAASSSSASASKPAATNSNNTNTQKRAETEHVDSRWDDSYYAWENVDEGAGEEEAAGGEGE